MTIDFNQTRELSYLGIRRAAIFMGFGINCADNNDLINFDLHKYSMYKFTPESIGETQILEYKTEFKKWIICNAFRELSDSFELYLNEIYKISSIFKKPIVKDKKYLHSGISDKLTILENEFSIVSEFKISFDSINTLRNCLYHRKGIVGIEDINDDKNNLTVQWLGIDLCQSNNNCNEKIAYPIIKPIMVKKGNSIVIIHSKRIKSFSLGQIVEFTVDELSEICYHFNIETDNLYKSAMTFFTNNGANIVSN